MIMGTADGVAADRDSFRMILWRRHLRKDGHNHGSVARKAPSDEVGDRDLRLTQPKAQAAGIPGVVAGLAAGLTQMGVRL
jgi:hypothetical protein